MTPEERKAYLAGGWAALNDVLAWLNTLEDKVVKKTDVYAYVFDVKPSELLARAEERMNDEEKKGS